MAGTPSNKFDLKRTKSWPKQEIIRFTVNDVPANPLFLKFKRLKRNQRFFAVFDGIKMRHKQPGGKVEASDCDDSMTFKMFTSFTCLKIKGLNVYRLFTDWLHM